jgi:serine/threonine-protein kinase
VKKWAQTAFLFLLLVAAAQALWQHGQLPERVATHFDGAGRANGWMSRGAHTALQLATLAFVAAVIQGIVYGNARLPKEYINIPHRDYWLAPERAAATHDWIGGMVLLIGCVLAAFFAALFQLIYRANLASVPQLDLAIWFFAAGLVAVTLGLVFALVARFARVPAA